MTGRETHAERTTGWRGPCRLAVLAALATCLALAGDLRAQAPAAQRVPGTRVRLAPPAGFEPAERFAGFQREELQAAIMVSVLPFPAAEMRRGMTREALAKQGMTLLATETVTVDGGETQLLRLSQAAGGASWLKWMVVLGDAETAVLVVAIFPAGAGEELDAAIKAAVLGATLDASGPVDLAEGLPFSLEPGAVLKLASRLGNMLLLTESGQPVAAGPHEAVLVVGCSFDVEPPADLRAFSEARVRQTVELTGIGNLRGRDLLVGGLPAHETLADAADEDSGIAMLLYQVVVPDERGYFLLQGLVSAERTAEVLPVFRAVTATFSLPDAPVPEPTSDG